MKTKRARRVIDALAGMLAFVEAAARSCGHFRYRTVTFRHTGILLDQVACAAAVDAVFEASTSSATEALRRVTVRIERAPTRGGIPVAEHARWAGGIRDRGLVLLRAGNDVPDRIERCLLALLDSAVVS